MSGTYEVRLVGSYKKSMWASSSPNLGACVQVGVDRFHRLHAYILRTFMKATIPAPVYPDSSGRHRLHGWRHHLDHLMLVTYKLGVDTFDNVVAVAVGVAFFVCYLSIRSAEHNVRALQHKKNPAGMVFADTIKENGARYLNDSFHAHSGEGGATTEAPSETRRICR